MKSLKWGVLKDKTYQNKHINSSKRRVHLWQLVIVHCCWTMNRIIPNCITT